MDGMSLNNKLMKGSEAKRANIEKPGVARYDTAMDHD